MSNNITTEIRNIFDDNELNDLKRFIARRKLLNNSNSYLIYLFHIVQSAGVFTTTVAAGYNDKRLIWFGVGLNILASLINIFEQTNNNISKKLLQDITAIKTNKYIVESTIIDTDTNTNQRSNTSFDSNKNPLSTNITSTTFNPLVVTDLSNSIMYNLQNNV